MTSDDRVWLSRVFSDETEVTFPAISSRGYTTYEFIPVEGVYQPLFPPSADRMHQHLSDLREDLIRAQPDPENILAVGYIYLITHGSLAQAASAVSLMEDALLELLTNAGAQDVASGLQGK